MPNEIETVRRRIIVDKPLESEQRDAVDIGSEMLNKHEKRQAVITSSGNNKTTDESRDGVRCKKPKREREYELNKKLDELYSQGKLIHTDIRYYVEVLGIDIGNIIVNVDNYLEVLLAADKEARRRGFLF